VSERLSILISLAVGWGCVGYIDDAGGPADGGDRGDATAGGADAAPGAADAGAPGPDADTGDRTAAATCARWLADRADMREGAWSGDVASCNAGDDLDPGRGNALRLINLYRWLAELPAVTDDADLDAHAQACALMMRANGQLSHQPPATWACYTAEGAGAAGRSNISSGPGVRSIDAYMNDWSSPTSLGHRRWILSSGLGPVGVGSTDSYSCLWVINGVPGGGPAWTAFPPPGPFPLAAARSFGHTLDGSGWSIQSNSIRLGDATIEVSEGGTVLPTTVTTLGANYGSSYAVSIVPGGWTMQAGKTYRVSVTGVPQAFAYSVQVVDCGD